MKKQKPDPLTLPELRRAAVDLLSRRDHSRQELHRKLLPKAASVDELNQLLDELAERRWQSDSRFAETFVNSRINRGHGPVRVKHDLRSKGVASDDIHDAFADQDTDWNEKALDVARRKFGLHADLSDMKLKAKVARFLAYRGFTTGQIQFAMARISTGEDTTFTD